MCLCADMKDQPNNPTSTGTLTVLSVSPNEEDHSSLASIIGHSKWTLLTSNSLPLARTYLQSQDISVVVCECDLQPGTWIDLLEHMQEMANAPSLIVTSRLADERLWAKALNLGAWDVLPKPYDRSEVLRSVKSAWQHWYNQVRMPVLSPKVMTVAS